MLLKFHPVALLIVYQSVWATLKDLELLFDRLSVTFVALRSRPTGRRKEDTTGCYDALWPSVQHRLNKVYYRI